jgi:hypothetical protein
VYCEAIHLMRYPIVSVSRSYLNLCSTIERRTSDKIGFGTYHGTVVLINILQSSIRPNGYNCMTAKKLRGQFGVSPIRTASIKMPFSYMLIAN